MKKIRNSSGGKEDGMVARDVAAGPGDGGFGVVRNRTAADGDGRCKAAEVNGRIETMREAGFEEIGSVHLSSKLSVWLSSENAVWGEHRIFKNDKTTVQAILNADGSAIVAVLVGNLKSGKLHVSKDVHWERLSSTQLGPGLDWIGRKSWDVRCPERDLLEVARTGKLPANRRVMGALSGLAQKLSSKSMEWEEQ